MLTVTFFTFNKRYNSTSVPEMSQEAMDTRQNYECVLLEPSSIINPIIKLDTKIYEDDEFMGRVHPWIYNYCSIPEFRRYYFITDIEANHGLWTIYLEEDVMASFAREIKNTKAYVLRSERFRNSALLDAEYPATASVNVQIVDIDRQDSDIVTDVNYGCYIIGVIGPGSGTLSSVATSTYYALTMAQFRQLIEALFTVSVYANSGAIEITDDLLKILFNPYQYISTLMYIPTDISNLTTENSQLIRFGWWLDNPQSGITVYGYPISNPTTALLYIGSFDVYRHPEAGNSDNTEMPPDYPISDYPEHAGIAPFDGEGNYLNYSPYSDFTLHLYPFGSIPLDSDMMGLLLSDSAYDNGNPATLNAFIKMDIVSGSGYLYLIPEIISEGEDTPSERFYIPRIKTKIGVDIQIGQITSDALGGVFEIAKTASSSLGRTVSEADRGMITSTMARVVEGTVNTLSSIYDGLKMAAPKLQCKGETGNFTSLALPAVLECVYKVFPERAVSECGYPLFANATLKVFRGFVKTAFNDIIINDALKDEREKILQFLNGGAYIED